ncbi:MAG: tetratricopeptide repeat protein [Planctomycetota bacterium]
MAEEPVEQAEGGAEGAVASPEAQGLRERLASLERNPARSNPERLALPMIIIAGVAIGIGVVKWVGGRQIADYDAALDSVSEMLIANDYDGAVAYLNNPISSSFNKEPIEPEQMARFFALSADSIFMGQQSKGLNVRANNVRSVDLYKRARQMHAEALTPDRRARLATGLMSLNEFEEALAEIRAIPGDVTDQKHEMLKQIIIDSRAKGMVDELGHGESIPKLLNELRDSPGVSKSRRLWAIAEQAEYRLQAGYPEGAIEFLLPELNRLETLYSEDAGRLFVLLGRAYFEIGYLDDAREKLSHAADPRVLPGTSEYWGEARYWLARLDQIESELHNARDALIEVTSRFPQTHLAAGALLALGEIDAGLGDVASSIGHYQSAVLEIASRGHDGFVSIDDANASLIERHDDMASRGENLKALNYAKLIEQLYPGRRPPADVVRLIGEAHQRLADELMAGVPLKPSGELDLASVDPVTLEEARSNAFAAGQYFEQHADQLILGNPDEYAQSIWLAATNYDKASAADEAIEMFTEYVQVRHEDPQALEGMHRLGQAYMAKGDFGEAINLFEQLIAEHPRSKPAADSAIPLARAYLYVSGDSRWTDAETLLLRALAGGTNDFTPDSADYRAALIELGMMYRRVGEQAQAISRLEEAIDRYEDLNENASVLFALADAYRMSALDIAGELKEAMPQSERYELRALRLARLEGAFDLYDTVRKQLMAKDKRRLSDLDKVMLRNAMFYRGDCVYDIGDPLKSEDVGRSTESFTRAIEYYDTAAQRYSEDPSSLVAMMQIVNCYLALGQQRQAETAHERARSRLAELPDAVWDEENMPMNRRHWEQWLESSLLLDSNAPAQGG